MHIGVLGDPDDLAAVYVSWIARQRGIDVLELPEAALGTTWDFAVDDRLGRPSLSVAGRQYTCDAVAGVFLRFNPRPPLPEGVSLGGVHQYAFIVERREALHHLLQALPCVVVNRPSGGRANASKPYQMRTLAAAGFDVPRWTATNDVSVAERFVRTCARGAIYKAASGLRSQVRRVDETLFARLADGTAAVVLQEYVPGRDVRVHTVRGQAFATEVVCDGIDYRFESDSARYRATDVPEELRELCCRVAVEEGLELAGFDFRATSDGDWYCLEVNPVPSFLPYEMASGLPIGRAIVDVLCGYADRRSAGATRSMKRSACERPVPTSATS
jgi:hypothetical protein